MIKKTKEIVSNTTYKAQNKKTHTVGMLFIALVIYVCVTDMTMVNLLAIIALELPILFMTLRSALGKTPHVNERFY